MSQFRVHVFLSVLPRLMAQIAQRFAETAGADVAVFSLGASLPEYLDQGVAEFNSPVETLRHWEAAEQARGDATLDWHELASLEERFSPVTIAQVIAADRRHNKGWSQEELLRLVQLEAAQIGRHLDRFSPDVVVLDDVACIPSYVLWLLARDRGIPVIEIGSARTQNRVWFRTALYEDNDEYKSRFHSLVSGDEAPDLSQDADVGAYLDQLAAGSLQLVSSIPHYQKPPSVSATDARTLWRLRALTRRTPGNRVSYGAPSAAVKRRVMRIARDRRSRQYFQEQPPAGSYAFFGLHVQPEASTDVMAPWFVDQIAVIRQVALGLPVDWTLVVKEHKPALGRRPLQFYRELLDIPNVCLLSPDYPTLRAIAASRCVVTLTGTMGWEAWCLGKPVAAFGESRYADLPSIYRVGDARGLRTWFASIRDGVVPIQTIAQRRAAIRALLDVTAAGTIVPESQNIASLRPENVTAIAEGLWARYQWILTGNGILSPAVSDRPHD